MESLRRIREAIGQHNTEQNIFGLVRASRKIPDKQVRRRAPFTQRLKDKTDPPLTSRFLLLKCQFYFWISRQRELLPLENRKLFISEIFNFYFAEQSTPLII